MTMLAQYRRDELMIAVPPAPRSPISVRSATKDDLSFIDQLQKMHSHMVGFTPLKALEKRIEAGQMVIAEETPGLRTEDSGLSSGHQGSTTQHSVLSPQHSPTPLGYCLAADQYMKRDDVGIVYQLNVLPLKQRGLIGASLIKAVFERAAYGCRLFCCWCAQDIQANWFWESLGFVPLAFRTGSRSKQRIHIFWQRRVRDNDTTTPYWFPAKTEAGAVGEDRIVLPIPPGTHWRDAKPLVLPGIVSEPEKPALPEKLPGGALVKPRPAAPVNEKPKVTQAQRMQVIRSQSAHLQGCPPGKAAILVGGRMKYIDRGDAPEIEEAAIEQTPAKKPRKPRAPRQKHDPEHVKQAREFRDRFLEEVNTDPAGLLPPAAYGKYDVSRQLGGFERAMAFPERIEQLPAPAPAPHLLEAA